MICSPCLIWELFLLLLHVYLQNQGMPKPQITECMFHDKAYRSTPHGMLRMMRMWNANVKQHAMLCHLINIRWRIPASVCACLPDNFEMMKIKWQWQLFILQIWLFFSNCMFICSQIWPFSQSLRHIFHIFSLDLWVSEFLVYISQFCFCNCLSLNSDFFLTISSFRDFFFSFSISKLWEIAITFFFASLWKQASVILLFSEYALRQSTLTIKAFIMLQNIYISNKCCVLNFLFGKESCKQMYFNFHGNIKQHNIDNNKKCFLCSRSVY